MKRIQELHKPSFPLHLELDISSLLTELYQITDNLIKKKTYVIFYCFPYSS